MKQNYTAPELEVFLYETDVEVMAGIKDSNTEFRVPGNPLLPYGNMDDVYGLGDEDDD